MDTGGPMHERHINLRDIGIWHGTFQNYDKCCTSNTLIVYLLTLSCLRPPIWRVAANKLNKHSRIADKGWSSSFWGLGEALTTPPRQKTKCYEILIGEMLPLETKQSGGKILPNSDLRGGRVFLVEASCKRKRKRDILLGTWKVRSLYRAGSLKAESGRLWVR